DQYHEVLAEPVETDRTCEADEIDPWGPWYLANPEVLAAGEPSHSVVGNAADVAQLGQAILCSGLWDRPTVDDALRPRVIMPAYGGQFYGGSEENYNVGLFIVTSGTACDPLTAPRTGSAQTFGHRGAPAQLGFTDPDTGTSFAYLTNGYPLAGYDYSPL